MNFIDRHAHYPMHLGLPKSASDNPILKLPKQALFDLANKVGNFEPINKPRVTAEKIVESRVTELASVLYDPEDEFLVAQEPHPIAIEHIRQQIQMSKLMLRLTGSVWQERGQNSKVTSIIRDRSSCTVSKVATLSRVTRAT